MDQRSSEDIAAAYVRLARSRMPAPEDLAESEPEPRPYGGAGARAEAPRAGFEDAVWFRIDLGRNKNAEARWLLPMICRRGHLTKRDIGAIRVFERETRFQISAEAADRFEAAVAKVESDGGKIQRLEEAAPSPVRETSRGHHRATLAPPGPGARSHKGGAAKSKAKGTASASNRPWAPPLDDQPAASRPRADRPAKGPKAKRLSSKKRKFVKVLLSRS